MAPTTQAPNNTLPFVKLNNTKFTYDLQIRFEPFHVELNPEEPSAKLPGFFTEDHAHEVAEEVFMIDPKGNMFQVMVEKLSGGMFFCKGWNDLLSFYELPMGGWARLVFIRSDRFLLKVKDRLEREVGYPSPPTITWVGKEPETLNCSGLGIVPHQFWNICQIPDIYHVLEKSVTYADVYSGRLHIPFEFCQIAFRQSGVRILIYDEFGLECSGYLQWRSDSPTTSGIADGWNRFCGLKRITPGRRIQLGVPLGNPNVMQCTLLN